MKPKKQKTQESQAAEALNLVKGQRSGAAPRTAAKREQGRPARTAPIRRLVVLLPPALVERLKIHAARESTKAGRQVSASWVIEQALEAYLPRE
jgi:hypothetical protein